MMHIKKIILENFQSHEYSEIEFEPGLNIILGKSDSGKTAIIRAIKWALYNEPSGDYFIRESTSSVSVTIEFSNGVLVRRFRSKSKNSYYLKLPSGEDYTFEGFGKSVPKEITDATSMVKINLDAKEESIINIAEQLDGPFLLNESNSVKAAAIGRLVDVNYIDDALRDTIRDNRSLQGEVKRIEGEKNLKVKELENYKHLDNYKEKLEKIKLLRQDISKTLKVKEKYEALQKEYSYIERETCQLEEHLKKFENLDKIEISLLAQNISYYLRYSQLDKNFRSVTKDLGETENILKRIPNLDTTSNYIQILGENLREKSNLVALKKNYDTVSQDIMSENQTMNLLKDIDKSDKISTSLGEELSQYKNIKKLHEENTELESRIKAGREYIVRFENLDKAQDSRARLLELAQKRYSISNTKDNYDRIAKELQKTEEDFKEAKSYLDRLLDEYNHKLEKAGICPYCFSEIDEDRLKIIRREYN